MTKQPKPWVQVGKYRIPLVVKGNITVHPFTDAQYIFWTAVLTKKVGKSKAIFGRARLGLSAGDRFDRMQREKKASYIPKADRPVYARMWEDMGRGANIKYIRPSTPGEVIYWMNTHPEQMKMYVHFFPVPEIPKIKTKK